MSIKIRVLTPNRVICSTTADQAILPGLSGEIGVLYGHAPLISCLDTGLLSIKIDEKWTPIIIYDGVVEIKQNRVIVVAGEVEEFTTTLKLSEASKEVEEATLKLEIAENGKPRLDALVELKKARARLQAAKYLS
jgi:F-type H+-transporting ATPase subunit epsilon